MLDHPSTKVHIDRGGVLEEQTVVWGAGLEKPDSDNIYSHLWSDGLYYKFPEVPEGDFRNLIAAEKMFISRATIEEIEDPSNDIYLSEDLMRIFLSGQTPVILHGSFGMGKTSSVEAMCEEKDQAGRPYNVVSLELSQVDASILSGMFYTHDNPAGDTVMSRSLPEVAQEIVYTYRETGSLTVFLLDEFSLAAASQQGASLTLLTHGKMGTVSLKPFIATILCLNPQGTVSNVNNVAETVLNRGANLRWQASAKSWLRGFNRGWVPEWEPRDRSREPSAVSKRFARAILDNHPRETLPFHCTRKKGSGGAPSWTPDKLVPTGKMELTPRSLSYFLRVWENFYDKFFGKVDDRIFAKYTERMAAAYFHEDWVPSTLRALNELQSTFGGLDELLDRTRDISWTESGPSEVITAGLLVKGDGSAVDTSELSSALDEAKETVLNGGESPESRVACLSVLWATLLAASASDTLRTEVEWIARSVADAVHGLAADSALREGLPEKLTPSFIPNDVKESVHLILASRV